jgi:uncharacterized protein (UPF0264 family)
MCVKRRGTDLVSFLQAAHETGLKVKLTGSVTSHLEKMTNIPLSIVAQRQTASTPVKKTGSFWKRSLQTASEE